MYVDLNHFLGFKILNFNIFWGIQKNELFWYNEIVDIFVAVITKLDYFGGPFLYILGLFLVQGTEFEYFLVVAKFQLFFGVCLIFLIFLVVNSRCWVQGYVSRKNESTPTPTGHHFRTKLLAR